VWVHGTARHTVGHIIGHSQVIATALGKTEAGVKTDVTGDEST
jgi:hypothetical protein